MMYFHLIMEHLPLKVALIYRLRFLGARVFFFFSRLWI